MGLFGADGRLEATLREWGRPATADISDAKRTHALNSARGPAVDGQATTATWHLRLQVKPDDEPPFDAKLTEAIPVGEEISVGQSVAVLYDPRDHSRVAIDHVAQGGVADVDAGRSTAASASASASKGDEGPGSPALNLMPDSASDRPAPVARRAPSPDGELAIFRQGMLAHPSAGRPKLTDVSRTVADGLPGGTPEDRLAKLADLFDRGAVSAAEFEQQKKKILEG